MPDILADKDLQEKLDRQGYVTVPLLDEPVLQQLRQLFSEMHPMLPQCGIVLGGLSADMEYKMKSSDQINKLIRPFLDRVFIDYHIQSSSFVFKVPDKKNEFLPHQDWTMVDEQKFVSVNCWIPLVDITPKNGPVCVLPGSHFKNLPVHRSHSLEYYFDTYRDVVYQYLVPITVKAGEAIILNHSLIHYSLPNYSNQLRNVVISAIKSKNAPNIMYFKPSDADILEIFEMPADVVYRYSEFAGNRTLRPYGKYLGSIPFRKPGYSRKEVDSIFREMLIKSGYCRNEWDIFRHRTKNSLHRIMRRLK